MKNTQKNKNDIEYYYKNNRFWELFWSTRKYKDLIWSKEAFLSLCLSVLTLVIILIILFKIRDFSSFNFNNLNYIRLEAAKDNTTVAELINLIRSLLNMVIAGLFGLLGFLVGGLAILTGTMSNKVLKNIYDDGKIKNLMSIIFNFYFSGGLLGFGIVVGLLSYLVTYTAFPLTILKLSTWVLFVSYFLYFALIYTVMLLGTCLRIFLLSYRYYEDEENTVPNKLIGFKTDNDPQK